MREEQSTKTLICYTITLSPLIARTKLVLSIITFLHIKENDIKIKLYEKQY